MNVCLYLQKANYRINPCVGPYDVEILATHIIFRVEVCTGMGVESVGSPWVPWGIHGTGNGNVDRDGNGNERDVNRISQRHSHSHHFVLSFYRAMLCIRGTSHGPVSVSVCLSVCHKSEFY